MFEGREFIPPLVVVRERSVGLLFRIFFQRDSLFPCYPSDQFLEIRISLGSANLKKGRQCL